MGGIFLGYCTTVALAERRDTLRKMIETKKIILVDGGLSSELQSQGNNIDSDPLWSARLLHSKPEAIVDAHKAYLKAGASVLTSASYQASLDGFKNHLGVDSEAAKELIMKSVDLARQAVKEYKRDTKSSKNIIVAGSVGPYGACLHDGSEYTGSYIDKVSESQLRDWHRPRIKALLVAGVDLLAIETIPSKVEAIAILNLLNEEFPQARAWVSFQCKDAKSTARGEPIDEAISATILYPQIVAVGINCCDPNIVGPVMRRMKKVVESTKSRAKLIAYPNTGEAWSSGEGWLGRKDNRCEDCLEWCNAGHAYSRNSSLKSHGEKYYDNSK